MRFFILIWFGMLIWAGNINIYHPDTPSKATASPITSCSADTNGQVILQQLQDGNLTNIHEKANMLTISLSSQWNALSPAIQHQAYQAMVCYANSQQKNFRLMAPQSSGT